jgi:hypothetical protein
MESTVLSTKPKVLDKLNNGGGSRDDPGTSKMYCGDIAPQMNDSLTIYLKVVRSDQVPASEPNRLGGPLCIDEQFSIAAISGSEQMIFTHYHPSADLK